MNLAPEGTILRESRVVSTAYKIKVVLILLALLMLVGVGLYVWQSFQVSSSNEVNTTVESELPLDLNMYGNLYFSANRVEDEFGIPEIYKHSFDNNVIELVFNKPAYSYSAGNLDVDFGIGFIKNTKDHDGYQPVSINKTSGEMKALPNNLSMSETDFTISPDNKYYAYSFKLNEDDTSDSLTMWNVAIYNYETGEVITIPRAAEPEFINDGADVVYMTSDGLFLYNLKTKQTLPLTTLYQNLTIKDDYAISSDSKFIVMTILSLYSISILQSDIIDGLSNFKEIKLIKSENAVPRFPEISPDNKFFAVMAAKKEDFDSVSSNYKKITAEIRYIGNGEVIQEVSFDGLKPQSVVLEEWTTN